MESNVSSKRSPMVSIFLGIKSTSWTFILLASALVFGVIAAANKTVSEEHELLAAIYTGTAHLVTPTLLQAGFFSIFVLALLLLGGKLSLPDMGWKWEFLVPGLAATVVLWLVMQLVEVIANFALNGQFQFSSSWSALAVATAVGVLVGQFFGTAVSEETFFRGFLLPQLRLKFNRMSGAVALGLAIVVSQLAFSLYHLPNLILGVSGEVGTGFADISIQLAIDFAIGVVFAAVYLRTGNLFLVMGIHALQNAGTSVVVTPIDPSQVMLSLAIIVFLATFVPEIMRRLRGVGPTPRGSLTRWAR